MYTQIREGLPLGADRPAAGLRVGRNVVLLGVTSLLTDVSSEMVSTVLPLYLVFFLRLSSLQLGVVDGLYQGVTALVRLGAGAAADARGRHKEVALAGYGLSALCKLGLLAAGGAFAPLVGTILVDRAGKGLRTAPRDTLISLSAEPDRLGTAFGVHRALDTAGAMVGPLLAFAILTLLPGAFDAVFVVSFCFAALGVLVLALFVQGRRAPGAAARAAFSLRASLALLVRPRFRLLVLASGWLGLATIADAFVYLVLQRRVGFGAGFLPLLYVATSLIYLLLAIPAGRLADRFGRERVLVAGYLLLAAVYAFLLLPTGGGAMLAAALVLFGAYYACTDGVMAALASAALPAEARSTGLALQGTSVALSRLAGSVLFGGLWTVFGANLSTTAFLAGLVAGLVLLGAGLARTAPR